METQKLRRLNQITNERLKDIGKRMKNYQKRIIRKKQQQNEPMICKYNFPIP